MTTGPHQVLGKSSFKIASKLLHFGGVELKTTKNNLIVVTTEVASPASFVYSCMQMRLMRHYNGK